MRRIRFLIWKELIELRQDPRLFGIVVHRADHPAVAARLRRDDRRAKRADRRRRRRSVGQSRELIQPVRRLAELQRRRRGLERRTMPDRTSRTAGRGWRWRFRAATARPLAAGRSADAAAGRRRQRRQLRGRVARLRRQPDRGVRVRRSLERVRPHGWSRPPLSTTAKRWRHRAARARLVQPAAREPRLHDPRHRRAAAAGRDDQSVVDGHRARTRARHARAVERDAAPPARADRRQAAAVRAHRPGRRRARARRSRSSGSRCRMRGSFLLLFGDDVRSTCSARSVSACSSRRSRPRSSRR